MAYTEKDGYNIEDLLHFGYRSAGVVSVAELRQAKEGAMIAEYQKKTSVAGVVCLVAVVGVLALAALTDPKQAGLGSIASALMLLVAGVAFIYAAWCHIKAKGRSGWWMLVLIFNLLGILILALLKDRTIVDEKKAA